MKKTVISIFCVLLAFFFVGCASTSGSEDGPKRRIEFELLSEQSISDPNCPVTVGVYARTSDDEITGFELVVDNKSNEVAFINWAKSSITYFNDTYLVLVEGQRIIDSNNPMPALAISPNTRASKLIWANGQLVGTTLRKIPTQAVSVMICVETGGKDVYYITNFYTGNISVVTLGDNDIPISYAVVPKKTNDGETKVERINPTLDGNFELINGEHRSLVNPLFPLKAEISILRNENKIIYVEDGAITFFRNTNSWFVIIRLCYTDNDYWFEYVDSYNLGADPATNTIHRNYWNWIEDIEDTIEDL